MVESRLFGSNIWVGCDGGGMGRENRRSKAVHAALTSSAQLLDLSLFGASTGEGRKDNFHQLNSTIAIGSYRMTIIRGKGH